MPSTIKLKREHLLKVAQIAEHIVMWKSHSLRDLSWSEFENKWFPSFLQQITDNEWKLNHTKSNTFKWLIDQIRHCKKLSPGVDPRHAVPLADTLLGKEVIIICEQAARGQINYDIFCSNTTYSQLFEEIR